MWASAHRPAFFGEQKAPLSPSSPIRLCLSRPASMAINPDEIAKARVPPAASPLRTLQPVDVSPPPCVVSHAHARPLPHTPGVCCPLLPGL